jgi:hypothetical protein
MVGIVSEVSVAPHVLTMKGFFYKKLVFTALCFENMPSDDYNFKSSTP